MLEQPEDAKNSAIFQVNFVIERTQLNAAHAWLVNRHCN